MENLILFQVNALGAVLGYPFHVYSDGTCGKKAKSPITNEPFVLRMKCKVDAPKVVLESDFWEKSVKTSDEAALTEVDLDTLSEDEKKETLMELVTEHVTVCAKHCSDKVITEVVACCGIPTELLKGLLEEERFELIEKLQITNELNNAYGGHKLPNVRYLIEKGYAKLVKNTIDKRDLSDSEFATLLKSGDDEMFEYYVMRHQPSQERQKVLIGCGTSGMIKKIIDLDGYIGCIEMMPRLPLK